MLNNFNNIKQIIMKAHTKETQEKMTPQEALNTLKEGNQRFQNNIKANRNLSEQVSDTSSGQYPFATILSCIDSRVSSELIFDQGIGDIFSARVAGNFVNEDILGKDLIRCFLDGDDPNNKDITGNTFFTPGIMIDVDNVYHNILISEEFNEWHSKLCPNKTLNRWPIGNIDLSNTTLPTKISDEVLEYSFE